MSPSPVTATYCNFCMFGAMCPMHTLPCFRVASSATINCLQLCNQSPHYILFILYYTILYYPASLYCLPHCLFYFLGFPLFPHYIPSLWLFACFEIFASSFILFHSFFFTKTDFQQITSHLML